jgi:hypothetical protein
MENDTPVLIPRMSAAGSTGCRATSPRDAGLVEAGHEYFR